jgi:hypothetical protein
MKIARIIVVLIALIPAPQVVACTQPDVPTFRQSLDSASNVFVFRLLSTGLVDKSRASRDMAGLIESVEVLKGKPTFRYIRHDAVWCGGLRLAVGHYYLVASRQGGTVLTLVRGDRSIADVSSDYTQRYPPAKPDQLWTTQFKKYLAGEPLPDDFNPQGIMERVQAFPLWPEEVW